MASVIVAAKPLSIDRRSISLGNLRVLGHEIAVGHAHFPLETPAREGANVLPSIKYGRGYEVWTRLPACATIDRSLELRGGRDSLAGVSATRPVSFYFASTICGFTYTHRVAIGLKRCGFAVNAGDLG